jgi:cytidine deaminase
MKTCMICDSEIKEEDEKMSYLPIYVVGSEGLTACLDCRLIITEFVRRLMNVAITAKTNLYKRKLKELKDGNKV